VPTGREVEFGVTTLGASDFHIAANDRLFYQQSWSSYLTPRAGSANFYFRRKVPLGLRPILQKTEI
jgi:hypothetical protein